MKFSRAYGLPSDSQQKQWYWFQPCQAGECILETRVKKRFVATAAVDLEFQNSSNAAISYEERVGRGTPSATSSSSSSWSTFVSRSTIRSVSSTEARGNDGSGVNRAFEMAAWNSRKSSADAAITSSSDPRAV